MIADIIKIIVSLIKGFLDLSDSGNKINKYLLKINNKRAYLKALREKLNQMPFIYKEIDLNENQFTLDKDYVSPIIGYCPYAKFDANQLSYYDLNTNDGTQSALEQIGFKMLSECNRVIIFGSAGIGKTTFIQNIILKVIQKEKSYFEFNPFNFDIEYLPIFVPLKILNGETDHPIIKYILNIPFFSGKKGYNRLKRNLEKRKVLLFLDGFDEIYISYNEQNTIIKEINFLFSRNSSTISFKNQQQMELYNLIIKFNRIWLTSRMQFFFENPLDICENKYLASTNLLASLEFEEIGNKKSTITYTDIIGSSLIKGIKEPNKLISNLIDRYKERNVFYANSLKSSDFWEYFENNLNENVKSIKNNPLFLTTFFYVYININFKKQFGKTSNNYTLKHIIELCTKILLQDLDKEKVRSKYRTSIELRYQNPEKKILFLKFFSTQFYLGNNFIQNNAFTRKELYQSAIEFFKSDEAILIPIQKNTKHNIIEEIINQNFFIIVGENNGSVYFDFPHRRFKEIFAIDYFNENDNISILIKNIKNPNYREFIVMYIEGTERNHDKILNHIIIEMISSKSLEYYFPLFLECISTTSNFKLAQHSYDKILDFIIFEKKVDSIPSEIINNYELSEYIKRKILTSLENDYINQNIENFSRIKDILYSFNQGVLLDYLLPKMNNVNNNLLKYKIFKTFIEKYESKISFEYFNENYRLEKFPILVNYLFTLRSFKAYREWWMSFLNYLDKERIKWFYERVKDDLERMDFKQIESFLGEEINTLVLTTAHKQWRGL